jgi:hypothetical protein
MILHALDGNILAVLDALRFEHLTEGALALFGNQAVLCSCGDRKVKLYYVCET